MFTGDDEKHLNEKIREILLETNKSIEKLELQIEEIEKTDHLRAELKPEGMGSSTYSFHNEQKILTLKDKINDEKLNSNIKCSEILKDVPPELKDRIAEENKNHLKNVDLNYIARERDLDSSQRVMYQLRTKESEIVDVKNIVEEDVDLNLLNDKKEKELIPSYLENRSDILSVEDAGGSPSILEHKEVDMDKD